MRKIISLILALSLVFSILTVSAAEDSKVEIAFQVGDDTLSINGQDVKVEKPYIVGEGVTLVPLRVITEAFGAKVDWEGETKTITLTYSDVVIILQINNPIAEVNKKAETLLSAPELTKNGVTMVPLRFISETFGAVVGYDEKDQKITVSKGTVITGETVQGGISEKRIGDSYYGWHMDNPQDMQLSERSFDGCYTEFIYDDNNGFCVMVSKKDEDFDINKQFIKYKEEIQNETLLKADKSFDSENKKTFHLQSKTKTTYKEIIFTEANGYLFEIYVLCETDAQNYRDSISEIILTFDTYFTKEDTYDLANIQDGMGTFESKDYKISFRVPVTFYQQKTANKNEFTFFSKDKTDSESSIYFTLFSKSHAGSYKDFAIKEHTKERDNANRKVVEIADVVSYKDFDNVKTCYYTVKYKSTVLNSLKREVFFEVGDYVYNISVTMKNPAINTEALIDVIINSINAQPLSIDDAGILMVEEEDYEGDRKVTVGDWYVTVPNCYDEVSTGTSVVISDKRKAAVLSITTELSTFSSGTTSEKIVKSAQAVMARQEGVDIATKTYYRGFGNIGCYGFDFKQETNGRMYYGSTFVSLRNDRVFVFTLLVDEINYSEDVIDELFEVAGTLKFTNSKIGG